MNLKDGAQAEHITIIGAGFIGIKLAAHLAEKGLTVTLLEKEPRLAARMIDGVASRRIECLLRQHGVQVHADREVVEILNKRGSVVGVRLNDGRCISCQRVIQAVGIKPNIDLLEGSGIKMRFGVWVDRRMQTDSAGIYAAGDVAVTIDSITGERFVNARWPAATNHGSIAGLNMIGKNHRYVNNFPVNVLELFGVRMMTAGHPCMDEASDIDYITQERKDAYRRFVTRSGRLVGCILFGDVTNAGRLLNAMKRKEEICFSSLGATDVPKNVVPPNLGHRLGFFSGP